MLEESFCQNFKGKVGVISVKVESIVSQRVHCMKGEVVKTQSIVINQERKNRSFVWRSRGSSRAPYVTFLCLT